MLVKVHSLGYQGGGIFLSGSLKRVQKLVQIFIMMTVMVNHIIQQSHVLNCALRFLFAAAAMLVAVFVLMGMLAAAAMLVTRLMLMFVAVVMLMAVIVVNAHKYSSQISLGTAFCIETL